MIQTNNKISSHIAPRKKYQAPLPPSAQEVKESQNNDKSCSTKTKSFKLLKKLKIKQMFCKINNKISKILKRSKDTKSQDNYIDFMPHQIEDNESKTQLPEDIPEQKLEEKPKKVTDNLIEELTIKLKSIENSNIEESQLPNIDNELELNQSTDFKPIAPPRKKKCSYTASRQEKLLVTAGTLISASAKNSDSEESESGISSLSEDTSDDSVYEYCGKQKYEIFSMPVTSIRKTKVRRTFSWVKDRSLLDMYAICTQDSEMDCERNVMYSPKKTFS